MATFQYIQISSVENQIHTYSPQNPFASYLYTKLDAEAEQVEVTGPLIQLFKNWIWFSTQYPYPSEIMTVFPQIAIAIGYRGSYFQ